MLDQKLIDEILGTVPDWCRDLLDSTEKPWCVAGGAVRDIIRGAPHHDVDVMSFATTKQLVNLVRGVSPGACVKAPYVSGSGRGMGRTPIPIGGWDCLSDVEPLVISSYPVELWSALEHGWESPPAGRIVEFDFTCNAVAVWNTGHVSADEEVLEHIRTGRMAVVDGPRATRKGRLQHMLSKGFVLL